MPCDTERLCRGIGYLAGSVARSALLFEAHLEPSSNGDVPDPERNARHLQEALQLLYDSIAEARTLLPHVVAFAAKVFEQDTTSSDAPEGAEHLVLCEVCSDLWVHL